MPDRRRRGPAAGAGALGRSRCVSPRIRRRSPLRARPPPARRGGAADRRARRLADPCRQTARPIRNDAGGPVDQALFPLAHRHPPPPAAPEPVPPPLRTARRGGGPPTAAEAACVIGRVRGGSRPPSGSRNPSSAIALIRAAAASGTSDAAPSPSRTCEGPAAPHVDAVLRQFDLEALVRAFVPRPRGVPGGSSANRRPFRVDARQDRPRLGLAVRPVPPPHGLGFPGSRPGPPS